MNESTTTIIGLAIVVVVAAVLFVVWLVARQPSAAQADALVQAQIEALQGNRQAMAALEKAHTEANATVRQTLYVLEKLAGAVSPLTPIRADDALLKLLRDIQTPGAPTPPDSTQAAA